MSKYAFSKDEGAVSVGVMLSQELNDRMTRVCNILEMQRSALIRFLLTRGMDDLETKLEQRLVKLRSGEISVSNEEESE